MKITRRQLRKLISEVSVELSDAEVTAAKNELEKEGGAAGAEMVAKAVKDAEGGDADDLEDDQVLKALMDKEPSITKHTDGDIVDKSGIAESVLNRKVLRRMIISELKKVELYKKYSYGVDDIRDKTKAHDDIVGHTWLTHVRKKDSSLNEVGYVLWHSLDKRGNIKYYDVEWPNGSIETNVPAALLENADKDESMHEAHEAHGVEGYEEDSLLSERRYKKR